MASPTGVLAVFPCIYFFVLHIGPLGTTTCWNWAVLFTMVEGS